MCNGFHLVGLGKGMNRRICGVVCSLAVAQQYFPFFFDTCCLRNVVWNCYSFYVYKEKLSVL